MITIMVRMMMIKFSTVVRMKFYVSHVKVSKVAYQEGFKILQITRVIWKYTGPPPLCHIRWYNWYIQISTKVISTRVFEMKFNFKS